MTSPGDDSGIGASAFILQEAECSDQSDQGSDTEMPSQENSVEVDFISNEFVSQGNSLEVFQRLDSNECAEQIQYLTTKYVNKTERNKRVLQPVNENSPASKRVHIGFSAHSSGRHEALGVATCDQVEKENAGGECQITALLRTSNLKATLLARFKDMVGIGWGELTRQFKNNKTTSVSWVVACYSVHETVYESGCELLKKYCDFHLSRRYVHERYNVCLFLCSFTVAKCRTTVTALFTTLVGAQQKLLLAEPPRIRSALCAMFWFKMTLTQGSLKYGTTPEWLANQTVLGHQAAAEPSKFDLTTMVQWAYDLDLTEASDIAFYYAMEASADTNAAAWLASTQQAKYLRDCEAMVRHYKKAEMSRMTMSEHIHKLCQTVTETGSWLPIMNLFHHQGIEPIRFVNAMGCWLKGIPKKNTIIFIGPPDTGKSLLTNSLIKFLKGKTLSFAMHKSTFWMQPLTVCKAALIDDATAACLNYFDSHLRNILDGYPVCIDRKYKPAIEIKAPPLLVTTNIDITTDPKYYYLRSRTMCFHFENKLPLDENGNAMFTITDANWANFFTRCWSRLGLEEQEDTENGCRTLNLLGYAGNGPD